MKSSEYKLKTFDDTEIQVYEWLPDNDAKIRGIVQISHGMAEHAMRYADFADFLTNNGFVVFANDHRGHGKTAGNLHNVGFIGNKNGWDNIIADLKFLCEYAKEKHPSKPFFLLGHSMGSFLARKFVLDKNIKLDGAIFSATGGNPGLLGNIGILLTKFIMLFYPKNTPSKLLDKMSFGAFNNAFKPNRTKFDWLSKDNEQVDKYIQDPYCGGIFSIGFFYEMINGVLYVSNQKNIEKTPEDLSILLISGAKDPVGNNGKGVNEVYSKYKKAGIKDISMKLYSDGRHEMLNEINKNEVYEFILNWLKRYI
jgi:alpha-beta hydrolase superfamily lysophospholipase